MSSDSPENPARDLGRWGRTPASQVSTASEALAEPPAGDDELLSPRRRWGIVAAVILGGLAVIWLVVGLLYDVYYIPSRSMAGTLEPGDRILVRADGDPELGDIVIHQSDRGERVARVVGVAGDELDVRDGQLMRNGVLVDEPYVSDETPFPDAPVLVPPGHVFVMGDNRPDSSDSRFEGPVPVEDVTHRAVLRVWPLSRFGGL